MLVHTGSHTYERYIYFNSGAIWPWESRAIPIFVTEWTMIYNGAVSESHDGSCSGVQCAPGCDISRYGFLTVIKLFTLVIKRGINTINSGIYHFAFLIKGTFYTTSIPLLYHCIYPPCPPIRTVDTGGHGWTRVDTGGHGWTQVDTGGHSTNDRMHQATSCEARVLLVGGFRSNS